LAFLASCFSWLELRALGDLPSAAPYSWDSDYLSADLAFAAGVSAILYFAFVIFAAILSLRWIYRANSNAHVLSPGMSMSPGWNVGWFFVPIATWFRPFEVVREIWRVSNDPANPGEPESPSFLRAWWAFWLLTSVLGTLSFRVQIHAKTVGTAIFSDWLDILSSVALVPATYFFLITVKEVTRLQSAHLAEVDER
jgi:hypothetical protein